MSKLFPLYEVGSLPKLPARITAGRGQPVPEPQIRQVEDLGRRFDADPSAVLEVLEDQTVKARRLNPPETLTLADYNALLNLRIEAAFLDVIYDGETRRIEMFRHVAAKVDGLESTPEMIRSRGPDSWRSSVCVAEPKLKPGSLDALILNELNFVLAHSTKPVKAPMDDPYMIAVMSDNRFYVQKLRAEYGNDPHKLRYEAKREFTLALARNVIRPQVEAAVAAGAGWIQLDIPAATLDIEHIPIMVEGVNAVVDGIAGAKFSLHMCYPRRITLMDKTGYELLFPHILKLNPNVDHLSLEFASANQYEKDLAPFARYKGERKFEIGLGVVDITRERQDAGLIETPEEVRDRILLAARTIGDDSRIYVAPDCGMRQLQLDRCIRLYEIMREGVEMARRG